MEDKFSKFSLYVLIIGIITSLFIIINSFFHTGFGSKIINKPLPASKMMGPNADF